MYTFKEAKVKKEKGKYVTWAVYTYNENKKRRIYVMGETLEEVYNKISIMDDKISPQQVKDKIESMCV